VDEKRIRILIPIPALFVDEKRIRILIPIPAL